MITDYKLYLNSFMEPLEPTGYFIYHQVLALKNDTTFCPRNVFMCFVRIPEQAAIISLYGIN